MADGRALHVMHLLGSFEVGGAETVALDLARALNGEQFCVSVCALYANGAMRARFRAAGIRAESLLSVAQRPGFDVRIAWRLARLVRSRQVDIVHSHNRRAHVYGAIAGRVAGVPAVVCTRHGVGSALKTDQASPLERLVAHLASHHIAVCQAVLQEGVRAGRIRPDRATVVYNGIDANRFACRRPLQARHLGSGVLGSVGRLDAEKGHRDLFKAALRLLRQDMDVRVHVVGDGPARGQLQQAVRDLGIADRVCFLGTRDDVPDLLRGFDLFVLPSLTEGLPLTVIEAMASGLPVVATNVGGVPELVRHGETGLLVRPGSPDELADAIARLLEDPGLCHRMGRLGQRIAVGQFDLKLMARRHAHLYRALMTHKRVHKRLRRSGRTVTG